MELEKYGKQGLSASNFERIKGLLSMYKDACKIEMLEEEAEGGYSEARGRRYAKRDSMGRYSRDGGYSEDDDYSERRMGRGYSRDEATDHLMRQLGNMMEDADPKQRETLKKWMRELERD
jgi:hypothetical protein